jgi:putative pyoverdin transport system ATP-binding/permease protein
MARRILGAPLREVEELGTNRLFATLTDDVSAIVTAVTILPLVFVQGAIVLGCLAYLGWLSPVALAVVVVLLGVGIVTYRIPLQRGVRLQREQRELGDRLWKHLGAITSGLKELKLHAGRREAQVAELESTGLEMRGRLVRAATLFSAAAGWGQMVIFALVGTIVFALPLLQRVSPEALTGYALVLLYLMTPLEVLLESLPAITRARVSFRKLEALGLSLDAPTPAALPPRAAARPPPWRSLELVEVTHAYRREGEEGEFVLGPISLSLHPGEVVFLVGGNGSGKTTLAKVLVGLYAPDAGEVRLDGVPVDDAGREAYLQGFSVVFSDFFLFDALLGLQAPDLDQRARRYLSRLQLSHKVAVEDGRLSTTALSQGQRKRLALLTAYLEDRPFYLFDEWAADQDPVFKRVFYLELLPELKARGKTVVVISHDDHFYGVADRILKLDYGRLEYDGAPEGLRYAGAALEAVPQT